MNSNDFITKFNPKNSLNFMAILFIYLSIHNLPFIVVFFLYT